MGYVRNVAMLVITSIGIGSTTQVEAQQKSGWGSLPAVLATAGVLGVGIPLGVYTNRECDSGLCQSAFTEGFVLGATLGGGAGWLLGRGLERRGGGDPGSVGPSARAPVVGSAVTGPVFNAGSADDYTGLAGARVSVGVPLRGAWAIGVEAAGHQLRQEVILTVVEGEGQRRPTDRQLRVHSAGAWGSLDLAEGGAIRLTGTLGVARARFRETVAIPESGQVRGQILLESVDWGLQSGVGVMAGWTVPGTGVRAGFQARADWISNSPLGSVPTLGWSVGVWN